MKLLHISDLHIGKRVNEFSMLEEQKYILNQILNIIDEQSITAVMVAGDVYDKAVPSAEAVCLFDSFLVNLLKKKIKTFIISGNHDSAERIAFGSQIMSESGIYMSKVYNGELSCVTLCENGIEVDIYSLPFIKPVHVKAIFPDEKIENYTQAIEVALSKTNLNKNRKNILIAHQFVTGAIGSGSEELSLGTLDNVSSDIFNEFDYVALGHIHRPQKVTRETIRYSGTPLKYSFSESDHKKSVTVVEINNDITISTIPLTSKRDMRKIKGFFSEIISTEFHSNQNTDDYLQITLLDEDMIVDAMAKLRTVYPNVMRLEYDNKRTSKNNQINKIEHIETKTPLEIFEDFYQYRNNNSINSEQKQTLEKLIEKIWEGKK